MSTTWISHPSARPRRSALAVGFALACLPLVAGAQAGSATSSAQRDTVPKTLSLGDAARFAAERGASATAARERAAQTDARSRQRRADLLPSVTAGAQLNSRTQNTAALGFQIPSQPGQQPIFDRNGEVLDPVRTVDMRLRAEQRLVDLPALMRWRATDADANAANWDARAASDAAATRGAYAYLRVLRAEAQVSARLADSLLAAELLETARQQLAAGTAVSLDVTRAEAQLASTTAHLIGTRSERERSKLELLGVLSLPLDTPIQLTDSLSAPSPEDVGELGDDAVRRALAKRADLRAAEADAGSARLDVKAARAERLPTVSLFADQGSIGKNSDHLLNTYSYGLQVSLPIIDGFRRSARVDEERAREREADVRWRDLRLRTEVDVRSALVELNAARERVTAASARLRLAEQELAQARERFRAGVAGNADVITASMSLNDARDLVVDALSEYHGARVSLASAQGAVTGLK